MILLGCLFLEHMSLGHWFAGANLRFFNMDLFHHQWGEQKKKQDMMTQDTQGPRPLQGSWREGLDGTKHVLDSSETGGLTHD